MEMTENKIKGKWLEIKGELQKSWGELTDDDLEKTKGDMKAVSGLIQQKYGESQEANKKKLSGIFKGFEVKKDNAFKDMKKSLKK